MSSHFCRSVFCGLFLGVLATGGAAAQTPQENLFTFLATQQQGNGQPWMDSLSGDFWECMGINIYGSTTARAEVEAVFQGHTAADEAFYDASWRCGLWGMAAPWQSGAEVEEVDLGAPIRYDTPGITALNQMSGRPAGIEQIADPSAVRLPDGRIALYFAGDHRAAFQSARWVSKAAVASVSDPIEFEIEADYNLPTRLLWRQVFRLDDNRWRAFGNFDGIRSWDSPDGLNWTESDAPQVLVPTPTEVRDQLGLPQNEFQFDSFLNITHLDDGSWVGVMPHYDESMDSSQPDPNENGYNDPPFVLIYHSPDGFTWNYKSVLVGTSEGFVTQLGPDVFMFTMSGAVFFSRSLEEWTFGHSPHFHTYGPRLPDGHVLHFGTDSQIGLPLNAFRVTIDPDSMPQPQWRTMSWENLPTIEELRGEVSGVRVEDALPIKAFSVDAYPNPASGLLTVSWQSQTGGSPETVQLLDGMGRQVWTETVPASGTQQRERVIQVEGLASGVYLVRILGKGRYGSRSVVLVR